MPSRQPLVYDPPKVIGVADPDVDPAGYIPYELLAKGIDVVVPLWDNPASAPGERDILRVYFEQPGQLEVKIENTYYPADIKPEFIIHIGPEHLRVNGAGSLWYEQLNTSDNPAYSSSRTLTIDHTPVPTDLEEAEFLHVNLFGYLNCSTIPPLWNGVVVKIPKLPGFKVGDRCEVLWKGYSSLNASGPEITKARWVDIRQSLSDQDIRDGYTLIVGPYDIHIEPMVENSSATVVYRIYRGARLVGSSKTALAKIDRILPGEELPCGP